MGLRIFSGEPCDLQAAALWHDRSRFCETAQNGLLSSGLCARSISISRQCLTAAALFADKHGILLT
jgi:hypothetical protein